MAAFHRRLSFAQIALDKGDFKSALTHADSALELDATSYEAHMVAGRAAYHKSNLELAESEYRQATEIDSGKLPAWEGLANVQMAHGNTQEGAETYIRLGNLATHLGVLEKQREFLWRLGDAYEKGGRLEQAEAQLKALLEMPLSEEQRLEALCFLAEIQIKLETMRQEQRVHQAMQEQEARYGKIVRTISTVRLAVDASRADQLEGEQGGLGDTLKAIVRRTLPCPRYARFHEHHLQRFLSRLGAYPPRSSARNEKRLAAMRECVRMITSIAGGCCTPFPFEAAIWLLEEQEELYGGVFPIYGDDPLGQSNPMVPTKLNWYRGNSIIQRPGHRTALQRQETITARTEQAEKEVVAKVEQFGMKLAHQFPWSPAAKVAVGLALRRRFLSDPDAPSKLNRRKQIMETLSRGVQQGADSAAGWKALAELQYQSRMWSEAHATAVAGLEWSVKRRRCGHETLSHFALALRLVVARCLRRIGKLEEAEYSFKILAGWVTEGEVAFEDMAGSAPLSVRQQAMRGLAKIAIERGDCKSAKAQYERILGKVLLGRGPAAEHWAHAEYAWLQFQDGDLQTARTHLEKALGVASKEGCSVTEGEVAEHHYKLGRVLWDLGGPARQDPEQARFHFESASMEECDSQAAACMWLGHWYKDVARDLLKARNCYDNALQIDPSLTDATEALEQVRKQLPATSSFANMPAFNSDDDESEDDELPPSDAGNLVSDSGASKDVKAATAAFNRLPQQVRQAVLASGRQYSANSPLAGLEGVSKAK